MAGETRSEEDEFRRFERARRGKLTEYAHRLILQGALDAEVMDRAAMIVRLRSSKPDSITARALCKVLTRQAVLIREERDACRS